MRCRYCNIALAPLRSLADGEFCCDDHREAFSKQPAAAPPAPPPPAPVEHTSVKEKAREPNPAPPPPAIEPAPARRVRTVTAKAVARPIIRVKPVEPQPPAARTSFLRLNYAPPAAMAGHGAVGPIAMAITDTGFPGAVMLPAPRPITFEQNLGLSLAEPAFESAEESGDAPEPEAIETKTAWHWIRRAWNEAPRDLKLATVALPLLAVLAASGSFSKVPIKTVAPTQVAQVQKVVNEQWKTLTTTISNRAAVAYADDFRAGMDAWQSRSNLTTSWSYDAAGFVRPGPLALFKPTVDMSDYRFEFLGEIDQKAIGWVFRAQDLKNYYAMKLMVVKPGPLPLIDIVRYAVIDGKEGPHVHKPLPLTVRADILYRVLVDVRGSDFTVMAQGQVVDFWSDNRLERGGVGFFANRGERARLRWVEVSHQYDALGRVCAYLAPFGLDGRNGSFN